MRKHAIALFTSSILLSGTALAQQTAPAEASPAAGAPTVMETPTATAPAAPAMAPQAAAPAAPPPAAAPMSAPAAEAAAPPSNPNADKRFVIGVRPFGYGIPMGNIASGSKLSDLTSGSIPLGLDAGYLVIPNLMLGVYAQYAIAGGGTNWMGSGSDVHLGIQAQVHPLLSGLADPWFGLGVGYEILSTSAELMGYTATAKVKGPEFANLQAGLDFRVWSTLGIGPYASFSLGQYTTQSGSAPGQGSQSGSINNKAMHEWLTIGAHASISL